MFLAHRSPVRVSFHAVTTSWNTAVLMFRGISVLSYILMNLYILWCKHSLDKGKGYFCSFHFLNEILKLVTVKDWYCSLFRKVHLQNLYGNYNDSGKHLSALLKMPRDFDIRSQVRMGPQIRHRSCPPCTSFYTEDVRLVGFEKWLDPLVFKIFWYLKDMFNKHLHFIEFSLIEVQTLVRSGGSPKILHLLGDFARRNRLISS